ncbi:TPA: restriction endonuclease subunit S [Raoultella ornithinolytica]|nr:restriction endonuclease subunit S [Raoultella ornithinolytica]
MSTVEQVEVRGKYQLYPEYKDSGVEWVGDIPSHWGKSRIGFEASIKARLGWKGLKADEYVQDGYVFLATPNIKGTEIDFENVNYITKFRYDESPEIKIKVGDVLVTKDGSTTGTCNIVRNLPSPATVNSSIAVIRPVRNLVSEYLYYFFLSPYTQNVIKLMQGGMGVPHLFQADLREFNMLLPPMNEQRTIAAFLDYETARMDKLIAQQQRLVELLKEKRQAVISHAVTKGLNPDVPMKDSGVEWLGEVPKHWNILKFNHCASIRNGQVDPTTPPYNDYILIAPNHIESGTGRLLEKQTAEEQGADSGKYICKLGEVVYSKIRPALAKVCISPENNVICSADMYPINGKNGLNNDFLMWFLLCDSFTRFAVNQADRVAMPKINRDSLGECRIPVPPKLEQNRIVTLIKHKTAVLDALIDKSSKTTLLMQERRTALVSAAVTGKIDLRGWSKPTEEVAT